MTGKRSWRGESVWGHCIFFGGLSLLFIMMMLYPIAIAEAQLSETGTPQLTPTISMTSVPTASSTPELHGRVGANAGLVCGAGILVIIIIAGLMWSARWMQIRGHEGEQEGETE